MGQAVMQVEPPCSKRVWKEEGRRRTYRAADGPVGAVQSCRHMDGTGQAGTQEQQTTKVTGAGRLRRERNLSPAAVRLFRTGVGVGVRSIKRFEASLSTGHLILTRVWWSLVEFGGVWWRSVVEFVEFGGVRWCCGGSLQKIECPMGRRALGTGQWPFHMPFPS